MPKHCCCSVTQSCLTLCDPMDCSMPGSLSLTISQSLPKFMSIKSVMLLYYLILCHPVLLLSPLEFSWLVFSGSTFDHFCHWFSDITIPYGYGHPTVVVVQSLSHV